jgi:predicted kinase
MEAVIFVGVQASGKSSFYKAHFFRTHMRINLDMLRTRRREQILIAACLEARQPFVIDNTNPTAESRAGYIAQIRAAGFGCAGYSFRSSAADCLRRNADRAPGERVPDAAIRATHRKLEMPTLAEGFDTLYFVDLASDAGFTVTPCCG